MMNKSFEVCGRSGFVFLGVVFTLRFFCAAVSVQEPVQASTTTRLESPAREFRDMNSNDESAAVSEVLDPFPQGLLTAGSEFDSSRPVRHDAVVSMFHQAGSLENRAGDINNSRTQVRTEIPCGKDKLVLLSDKQERAGDTRFRATGHVVITFLDMVIGCDEAEYDGKTLRVSSRGQIYFTKEKMSLVGSGAEFDFDSQTIIFYDASGYFYDTSGRTDREFFLTGGLSQIITGEKLQINWGATKKD